MQPPEFQWKGQSGQAQVHRQPAFGERSPHRAVWACGSASNKFEIATAGTYFGISTPGDLHPGRSSLGPTAVPSNFAGDVLRYLMRLPSGVSEADPALHIRWILEDRTNDVLLVDEATGSAAGRLRSDFLPAGHANASEVRRHRAAVHRQAGP